MRYLITGGCGFLGANLSQSVLTRKEELIVVDNVSRIGSNENLRWLQSHGDFKFSDADIRDETRINHIIKDIKPDVIFHLASQVAMYKSLEDPQYDFEVNVRTLRRWTQKLNSNTWDLMDKSKRPETIHRKITKEIEEKVISIKKRTGWGAEKIETLVDIGHT